jgi:hypothetical protein
VSIRWRRAPAVVWEVFEREEPGGSGEVGGAGGASLGVENKKLRRSELRPSQERGKVGPVVPETDDMAFPLTLGV